MTPEQEDAHWALLGKPLMRHWLARLAELERADRLYAQARQLSEHALRVDETLWAEVKAMDDMVALIVRQADAAWWAAIPADTMPHRQFDHTRGEGVAWVIGGVKYTPTDGTEYRMSEGEKHERNE